MELLAVTDLSEEQIAIMQARVDAKSYREIQASW